MNTVFKIPEPFNEQVKTYKEGSSEYISLKEEIARQMDTYVEVPVIIGGREIKTNITKDIICPHDHKHVLGRAYFAEEKELDLAIKESLKAKDKWIKLPWYEKASLFLKMADLITGKYRYVLNASTMLNQSKNWYQAEIDAVCEFADFLRFNAKYMQKIYSEQPISEKGAWNRIDYRPIEGFVLAISPFNFTSIAGNLVTAPLMMGNTVIWKPSSLSLLSGYYLMKLFKEAGVPDGVVNFVPSSGQLIEKRVIQNRNLGGIHFTGSTEVFQKLWKKVGENIENYLSYPRLVGETGGKDYIFMHNTADTKEVATALTNSAFEYQGQKCSACSRAFIPRSRWNDLKNDLIEKIKEIKSGDANDFSNMCNSLIDKNSYEKTMRYIKKAEESDNAEILIGGRGNREKGYFVEPTVILAKRPSFITMTHELFAPVLTIFVYEDSDIEKIIEHINDYSFYALTGAIFSKDRYIIRDLTEKLKNTAGNFYINDKPSGAVVGQQPFGGARASGTNDKAGSFLNLLRWTSAQTIKESFDTPA